MTLKPLDYESKRKELSIIIETPSLNCTTIHIFLFQAFLLHIHTNTNGSIDHGIPTSNALQGQESFNPYANTLAMPVTHQTRAYQNYHALPASSNSGYNYWVRDLDHFSDMMVNHRRGGDIYRQGTDVQTNEDVAIKLESVKTVHPQLSYDSRIYRVLQGGTMYECAGFPNMKWFGVEGDYNINRLEFIHSKLYLHRDIKPDNFLMGLGRRANQRYAEAIKHSLHPTFITAAHLDSTLTQKTKNINESAIAKEKLVPGSFHLGRSSRRVVDSSSREPLSGRSHYESVLHAFIACGSVTNAMDKIAASSQSNGEDDSTPRIELKAKLSD
ncbi:hypothetical protein Bca52824_016732 [Brassica carinata]|uniref:Protein kinase domain-containing protein n=1 Tax=Brassica carinata TaxID=52824 RepID=A0A8X7W454_BRACI|nr:hypothetical protein Bca52824_016732 [Brassica carinata]